MIVLIVSNICLFFINVPHFMSFHLCVHISVFVVYLSTDAVVVVVRVALRLLIRIHLLFCL